MRQSLKIAVSLLISVLLFGGFTVLAFSGLFNAIEAGFFYPRIQKEIQSGLDSLSLKIRKYHEVNFQRFEARVAKDYVASAFEHSQSTEDISRRVSDFATLQKDLPDLTIVRLLDPQGVMIHFSTLATDVAKRTPMGIEYKTLAEADDSMPGPELSSPDGGSPKLLIDGAHDRFIYSFPVYKLTGGVKRYQGSALFYVSSRDLLASLLRIPQTNVANLMTVGSEGVLLNFPPADSSVLSRNVQTIWRTRQPEGGSAVPLILTLADGASETFMVFTAEQDPGGFVSVMVKSGVLEMSRVMKGLLLAVFFFTVFLIVFLLFNLRPDPVEVLSQRIKRFQIQLLEQLMGSQGGSDWERWKKELEARRGEITHQIMRGIGKVSPKQKPEVDAYVSKSWDEIIDLLGRRAEVTTSAAASPIDISRLENLIRQALKNAQFVAPLQKPISPSEEGLAAAQRSGAGQAALMEAEEPAEEVLEELEEARSTEAVPELEAVGEPAEAVEELEEIGEHEEAVPMGPELLAAPGVEEAEELEAVPDADEVEEAGEPVEVEEVSEIEEASGAEEPVEVEEISEVEEASEAEQPVEVEEALEVEEATEVEEALEVQEDAAAGLESGAEELDAMQPEELEEIEEPEPAAVATGVTSGRVSELIEVTVPSGTAELEDAELPAEDSAAFRTSEEYLEELEPIAEIIPLPPEPVEEGLELLPVADEKPAGMESPLEDWRLMIDSDKDRMREAYSYSESGGARPSGDVGEEAEEAGGSARRGADETEEPLAELQGEPLTELPAEPSEELPVELPAEPSVEEAPEALEELEEVLEAFDEPSEQVEQGAISEAEKREEIGRLVASGVIKTIPLDKLQNLVDEVKSAIVIEDGVFRIKEEVYSAGEKGREGKLKELAEEVIRHEAREETPQADKDEGVLSGIGDLLQDEEAMDLAKVVGTGKESSREEMHTLDKEKSWILHLKRNGIDYDEFLSEYPRSFTHTAQMKSLVEISRRVSAVGAGILLKKVDGYAPDLTIGAGERTIQSFRFPAGDPVAELLDGRMTISVDRALSEIRSLNRKLDADDLRFMKRMLLLPATFRGQEAYLFFFFASDTDVSLDNVFSCLKVR